MAKNKRELLIGKLSSKLHLLLNLKINFKCVFVKPQKGGRFCEINISNLLLLFVRIYYGQSDEDEMK